MEPENEEKGEGGELSKNALKKKAKADEAAKKKAEKEAQRASQKAAEPESGAKGKLGGEEDDLDPTQYFANRLHSVQKMQVILRLRIFFVYCHFIIATT
jgi:hypothetical protein